MECRRRRSELEQYKRIFICVVRIGVGRLIYVKGIKAGADLGAGWDLCVELR